MENNVIIGAKIKSIRESKQMAMEEVAERSGLPLKQIECIENDNIFPSLGHLIKVARALGVHLDTFLDEQSELGPVICRKKESESGSVTCFNNHAYVSHEHMAYHALSRDKTGRHMEPFMIDIEPSADVDFVLSTHEGEEFIYVLEGIIEIYYGEKTYVLEEGDSIYYDSFIAHHVHAGNGRKAKILGVVYNPY